VTTDPAFVVGGSTTLSGTTWDVPSVSPASLAFGRIPTGKTAVAKTVTISNLVNSPVLTISGLTFSGNGFSRSAVSGGTCGATLAAGSSCTVNVVYAAPATTGLSTGTLAIITSAPSVTGSPVALTGTSIALPTSAPTLPLRDNFNRANANTLGSNWFELGGGTQAIRVNSNGAACTQTFSIGSCVLGTGWAYYGSTSAGLAYGDGQAAAFQFSLAPANTPALLLKSSGTPNAFSVYPTGVRARFSNGSVLVETNVAGAGWTMQTTLPATFAANDTMTAQVDSNGNAYVWKTSGAITTLLGAQPLGDSFGFNVTGAIGIYMNGNSTARVDNFAGGTVPSP
jgi:hypothetical protein